MTRKNAPSLYECAPSKTDPINANLLAGIDLLWQAYCYAQDATVDLWISLWKSRSCMRPG
jgi:hypothetical protein